MQSEHLLIGSILFSIITLIWYLVEREKLKEYQQARAEESAYKIDKPHLEMSWGPAHQINKLPKFLFIISMLLLSISIVNYI
jgi:hypothetical protein